MLILALRMKLISKKNIFWTFHLISKMELMVLTKSQAIGFFILIVYQTTHQTSKSKFQIPSKTDCRKTCLMRRYSTQQVVNRTMLWRKVSLRLILNTTKINGKNQNIELEILFGLTHHSTQLYLQMLQKIFLRLINRHSPKCHRLHINRKKVKVSYSCMQNVPKINIIIKLKAIIVKLNPHWATSWFHLTAK